MNRSHSAPATDARAISPNDHDFLRKLAGFIHHGQEDEFLNCFAQRGPLQAASAPLIPNPDPDNNSENALVMSAIHKNLFRALQALLQAGVDPDIGHQYTCPLHEAASLGRPDIVALLLSNGANPDGGSPPGCPLAIAAWEGHIDCCVLLLEAGANPLKLTSEGQTPSEYARAATDYWPSPTPQGSQAADAIDAWVEAKELRSAVSGPSRPPRAQSKLL